MSSVSAISFIESSVSSVLCRSRHVVRAVSSVSLVSCRMSVESPGPRSLRRWRFRRKPHRLEPYAESMSMSMSMSYLPVECLARKPEENRKEVTLPNTTPHLKQKPPRIFTAYRAQPILYHRRGSRGHQGGQPLAPPRRRLPHPVSRRPRRPPCRPPNAGIVLGLVVAVGS